MNKLTEQATPKERILQTVNRLFYTQGYLATGINQIIAEAQVAKASFYQHFPSKEELVLEYIKTYNLNFLQELSRIEKQHKKPKAKILALFDHLMDFSVAAECRGCTMMNIAAEFSEPDSKPRQLIIKCKQELKTFIEKLALECFAKHDFSELVLTKATTIYLLYEAALIESRVYQDVWPVKKSKEIVTYLLN